MKWDRIRLQFPQKWLLVEAVKAHSDSGKRIVDDLAVVDDFADSVTAMQHYTKLHRQTPDRELYVVHTSREVLDISEREWYGIRMSR